MENATFKPCTVACAYCSKASAFHLGVPKNIIRGMFQRYVLGFKIMAFSFLTALLNACTDGPVEVPGNLPNPKLVEMINASLDEQIKRMEPAWSPGFLAQAAGNARLWLQEINEVVARCRHGPRNNSKFNLLEYDILLRSGEVIKDVYTGQRCVYEISLPLVMRVRFVGGRVAEALTDGRERNSPVASAKGEIDQLSKGVVRADWQRRHALYFLPGKTASEISKEWQAGKP